MLFVFDSWITHLGYAAAPAMILFPLAPNAQASEESVGSTVADAPVELTCYPLMYDDAEPVDGLDDIEELYHVKWQLRFD